MDIKECTGSTLAYIGDAVWSLMVREYLVNKGYTKAKDLQRFSVKFVSAKAQATFYYRLEEEKLLNEEDIEIFKRGRNHHSTSAPKNTDVVTYRISTGFEALVGFWHMTQNETKLKFVWDKVRTWMEE